jgi:ATPases of the AAA+ class
LWSREAQLQPVILFVEGIDAVEPLTGEDSKALAHPRWPRALTRMAGPCVLDVRQPLAGLDTAAVIAVDPPSDLERRARWHAVLTTGDQPPPDTVVARLAGEFTASGSQIDLAARRAHAFAAEGDDPIDRVGAVAAHAWGDCVQRAGATLAGITRWVQPRITIDDVKLPAEEKAQLERLIRHARQRSIVSGQFGFDERTDRGLGITALLYGESGTGKTYAAEAVAHELSLGLAVVDLATVTSKYIGETQKNLRRIFDAADHGGAVLCFDEADALFGRRSEIKDSHDRYANAEINYLLTRMEHFTGVAILATNQKHALDSAFMRRLRFVIGFPFPGVEERSAIWRTVFPPQTPLEDLDYERLARFALSGGGIFSAALAAAHDAAADGQPVSMHHVLEAVRSELRKLERPVAEAEFRTRTAVREPAEVVA